MAGNAFVIPERVHIYPKDEESLHATDLQATCQCEPRVMWGGSVVIHAPLTWPAEAGSPHVS